MRTHVTSRLAVVALLVAACSDDPTGTDGPGAGGPVAAELTVLETEVGPAETDAPWIQCTFELSARLAGAAGHDVAITGALFRFHAGAEREEPIDSFVISGADMRAAFGGRNVLEPGETLTSGWYFRADVPYALTGALLWALTGDDEVRRAPFELTCGPELDDEAPPVLANVRISPSVHAIEAGQTMEVQFDASAEGGLWAAWVLVESPLRVDTIRVGDALRASASHSVTVRHPVGTPEGTQLAVRVVAFDAWLRPAVSGVLMSPAVYDLTAPWVSHFTIFFDRFDCTARECQLPDDTPIPFFFGGWDEGGLTWARVWLGDPVVWRDSADLAGAHGYRFRAPLGLDGVYSVSGSIADVGDNRVDFDMGAVNVFPARARERTQELLLNNAFLMLPDFEASRLVLVTPWGEVRVHDLETLALLDSLTVPGWSGIGLLPDGTLAVAHTDSDTVTVGHGGASLDTLVIDRTGLPEGVLVDGMVVTPDGRLLVLLEAAGIARSVAIEIDPLSGSQRTVMDATGEWGGDEMRMAVSGDGSRVVFYLESGCGRIYDAIARTLAPCVTTPAFITGSETGDRWATSRTTFDDRMDPIAELYRDPGFPAAPGPAGSTFVATPDGLMRYDEATGLIRESFFAAEYATSPYGQLARMRVSPDGTRAVIAGRPQTGFNTLQTLVTVVRLD